MFCMMMTMTAFITLLRGGGGGGGPGSASFSAQGCGTTRARSGPNVGLGPGGTEPSGARPAGIARKLPERVWAGGAD